MVLEEYKFQKLVVYQLSLEYADGIYSLIQDLPDSEKFNLCSQLRRIATSITSNIARVLQVRLTWNLIGFLVWHLGRTLKRQHVLI